MEKEIIPLIKLISFLINKLQKKLVRIHAHPGMAMTPIGLSFGLRFCVSNISDHKIYALELYLPETLGTLVLRMHNLRHCCFFGSRGAARINVSF